MARHRRRIIGLLRGSGFALLSLLGATAITAEITAVRAPPAPPPAAGVANVTPVTDAMLQNPDPADWLMWRRTLDSWGYSPLDADQPRQRRPAAHGLGARRSSRASRKARRWSTTASCTFPTRAT